MSRFKLESSGVPFVKRIVHDGKILALATQMTNGDWCVTDMNDKKISPRNFSSATRAKNWFQDQLAK